MTLPALRARIDELDHQILDLIGERARCVLAVAEVKHALGGGDDIEYYRPEREAQILRRIKARNQGPLSDAEVARLFREIISACMALEQVLRVAFAPESRAAAYRHFGQSIAPLPLTDSEAVLRAVAEGEADFGAVLQDSRCAALLANSSLNLCGESHLGEQRYLIVGRTCIAPSGADKTTVLLSAAACSRLIDLDGHRDEPAVQRRLRELRGDSNGEGLRVLGSYPKDVFGTV